MTDSLSQILCSTYVLDHYSLLTDLTSKCTSCPNSACGGARCVSGDLARFSLPVSYSP